MNTKMVRKLIFVLSMLLSALGTRADVLPSSNYAEVTAGTFYLYNVAQGQFMVRLSNNFPGLSNSPVEVTLAKSGSGYTLRFSDGKYLKTGFWNNQYLWTDGTAGAAESVWVFEAIDGAEKTYQLKRATADTLNGETGIFYANGTNAATTATEDCRWALIDLETYASIAKEKAVPVKYRSAIPTAEGQYYLYDVLNQHSSTPLRPQWSQNPQGHAG